MSDVVLGAILALTGSIVAGIFLYWLDSRRLERQRERDDRIRVVEREEQKKAQKIDQINQRILLLDD